MMILGKSIETFLLASEGGALESSGGKIDCYLQTQRAATKLEEVFNGNKMCPEISLIGHKSGYKTLRTKKYGPIG